MAIDNNDSLTVKKDLVKKAAESCPDAARVLKTLFPEAFDLTREEKISRIKHGTITKHNGREWLCLDASLEITKP